ncbi:hypothetical protein G6F42_011739 [Rhizopus arrhizus]|nr:hypothetical protein G6F42_011739 [Rhizopus arrhizus]
MHRTVITQLKSMMWEKDASIFVQKLTAFFAEYSTRFPAFMDYMKRNYLDNNGVAAFQPLVFTNMETKNYVESRHN